MKRVNWMPIMLYVIWMVYLFTTAWACSGCSSPDAVTITAYKGMEQGMSLSGPSFGKDVGMSVGLTWYLEVESAQGE